MSCIKKSFINFAKKHYFILHALRKVRFIINRISYIKYFIFNKTNNNLIIFESYMGRQYSCSPKAIYEQMLKNPKFDDFIYVWALRDPSEYYDLSLNKNTKIIKFGSKEYYKTYSKAKYWVSNSRINEAILKRKDQVYIQCWHGTPLKRLGYDIKYENGNSMNSSKDIKKKYSQDSKRYTYMISPSKFCTDRFVSAFNLKDKSIIKELGYPRNDELFKYKQKDVIKIKKRLNIASNKKVILYAPTWRDNQHKSGVGYTYKLGIDFDKLKSLSDEYVILFRTHYFVANYINLEKYKDFIINVSDYNDINDLYIVSDMLITDYSSVFFDYANLKRPIIYYMYDYDEYKNNLRDFYIKTSELPGPIVKNEDDLVSNIKSIDEVNKKYSEKYRKFNCKYNYLDDCNSSERVIEECIK